ncbi:MarR family winged helix-turn-helix transcriptional regulator [Nocardia sp. A7]|uniref:MarR family winged helix-turn-helix transcriptional regulator n=1 Tax=Nocardia sp. A7 TaxID=2789274 RepID=UPI00397C0F2E
MEKATRSVEFETMLLGRHSLRSRRGHDAMDRSAYILLSRLRMGGLMSIGQLSDALGLDASTLNRQTAAMMRTGVVERIPDPEGGMARKFRVSAEGERRLDAERTTIVDALDSILADWSAEDVAAFVEYLRRFNTDIERRSGESWPRPLAAVPTDH